MNNQSKIWQLGNKIIVFAGGGAFLGALIAQLPGAITGAIIAIIYSMVIKTEKEEKDVNLQADSSN